MAHSLIAITASRVRTQRERSVCRCQATADDQEIPARGDSALSDGNPQSYSCWNKLEEGPIRIRPSSLGLAGSLACRRIERAKVPLADRQSSITQIVFTGVALLKCTRAWSTNPAWFN